MQIISDRRVIAELMTILRDRSFPVPLAVSDAVLTTRIPAAGHVRSTL